MWVYLQKFQHATRGEVTNTLYPIIHYRKQTDLPNRWPGFLSCQYWFNQLFSASHFRQKAYQEMICRPNAEWVTQQVGLTRVEYWKIKSDTLELDKIWHSKCMQIHPFQKQIHASCLDVLIGISRQSFFPRVSWSLYGLYVTSFNMVLLVTGILGAWGSIVVKAPRY